MLLKKSLGYCHYGMILNKWQKSVTKCQEIERIILVFQLWRLDDLPKEQNLEIFSY